MALSLYNAKLLSTLVLDGISNFVSRRGYAVASQLSRVAGRSTAAAVKKTGEDFNGGAKEKVSWIPDPVTGCYRPQNYAKEIDVAELRAMLLKKELNKQKRESLIYRQKMGFRSWTK